MRTNAVAKVVKNSYVDAVNQIFFLLLHYIKHYSDEEVGSDDAMHLGCGLRWLG
jgi:hypothetical protein